MAYLLKCPSCTAVIESSFIRIGAVVTCESCNHQYRIDEEHTKREVPTLTAAIIASADPLIAGDKAKDRSSSRRLDQHGEEIGLSGLSEMMQMDVGPPPNNIYEYTTGKSTGKKDSRSHYHRRMLERQKAYRRTKAVLCLLVVGLLLVTTLMIWGLWLMSH